MTVNGVQRGVGKLGWITLAILSFAYAIAMIDRIILTLLVEPIKRDLQINDTQFGFLQGFAFAAFYAVAGLPLARIADNSSRKRLIAWGIAAWSFMTGLCALAWSYWQMVPCRIGVGVGEAALTPAAISMLSDLFPRRSEEHTSELQSLMRISYAVFCLKKTTTIHTPILQLRYIT